MKAARLADQVEQALGRLRQALVEAGMGANSDQVISAIDQLTTTIRATAVARDQTGRAKSARNNAAQEELPAWARIPPGYRGEL